MSKVELEEVFIDNGDENGLTIGVNVNDVVVQEKVDEIKSKKKKKQISKQVEKVPNSRKKKRDEAVSQFLKDVLPSLRKEMKRSKKEKVDLSLYSDYFNGKHASKKATYILPLFHFLGKDEIHCTRYGQFDNRHLVKTIDGFNHSIFLGEQCGDALSENEVQYIMKRFGREWHKIPARDSFRVSNASRSGTNGEFKIVLNGILEDSFYDKEKDVWISTLNPVLDYIPIIRNESAAPEVKESKKADKKKEKKEDECPVVLE